MPLLKTLAIVSVFFFVVGFAVTYFFLTLHYAPIYSTVLEIVK